MPIKQPCKRDTLQRACMHDASNHAAVWTNPMRTNGSNLESCHDLDLRQLPRLALLLHMAEVHGAIHCMQDRNLMRCC